MASIRKKSLKDSFSLYKYYISELDFDENIQAIRY